MCETSERKGTGTDLLRVDCPRAVLIEDGKGVDDRLVVHEPEDLLQKLGVLHRVGTRHRQLFRRPEIVEPPPGALWQLARLALLGDLGGAREGLLAAVAREGAVRLLRRHAGLPRAFSAQRFADLLGFSLPLTR